MKILLIVLLCASLTANALLFVQTSRLSSDSNASLSTPQSTAAPAKPEDASAPLPSSAVASPEILALLQALDPSAVQKLRELGFSEKAIRALVRGQVDAQFRARERALQQKGESKDFWKRTYAAGSWNPETSAARQELRREKDALLKKLLGADYLNEPARPDLRLAHLSPTKANRVRELEEDYNSMSAAIRGVGFSSVQFPEDREKLAYLEKEKRAELAEMLTPNELFEYDLRSSNVAASLRRSLAAFEPTEQEFREIFKLQQASMAPGTDLAGPGIYTRDAQQARQKAQEAVDQQVKTLLGDARFQEYKRANDPDYRRLYQIASRLQLPHEAAAQAQAIKTSIEDQRRQIMQNPELREPAKRTAALESLAQQAETKLKPVLGQEGFEAYRQAPGNFLQRLRPPPPPPARPGS